MTCQINPNTKRPFLLPERVHKLQADAEEFLGFHKANEKLLLAYAIALLFCLTVDIGIVFEYFSGLYKNMDDELTQSGLLSALAHSFIVVAILMGMEISLLSIHPFMKTLAKYIFVICAVMWLFSVAFFMMLPKHILETQKIYAQFEADEVAEELPKPTKENPPEASSNNNNQSEFEKMMQYLAANRATMSEEEIAYTLIQINELKRNPQQAQDKEVKNPDEHPLLYTEKSSWHNFLSRNAYIIMTAPLAMMLFLSSIGSALIVFKLKKRFQILGSKRVCKAFLKHIADHKEWCKIHSTKSKEREHLEKDEAKMIRSVQEYVISKYHSGLAYIDDHTKRYLYYTKNQFSWNDVQVDKRLKDIVHINPDLTVDAIKNCYVSIDKLELISIQVQNSEISTPQTQELNTPEKNSMIKGYLNV